MHSNMTVTGGKRRNASCFAIRAALLGAGSLAAFASGGAALAQERPASDRESRPAASSSPGEIIVTARKRQETMLDVPVIEKVVTSEMLARQQTLDLKDLTKLTPGLMIGTAVLSIGQQVTLRGVGTSSFDPGIDQSVTLNIDGLPLGQGLAFSSGMFDVGQVEVLKGPQSLFYGKSSTGGVISIHTADPTYELEAKATAAYEAEAHTRRFEGFVSGPVSSTLRMRLAGMYSKSDGYYYNRAVVPADATFSPAPGVNLPVSALGGMTPRHSRTGHGENYQIRGTVIWEPSEDFSAKLKVNYVHDNTINAENGQLKSCPDGVAGVPAFGNAPFINPSDTCKLDRVGYTVDMNPANFVNMEPANGMSFVESSQRYGTLELNYNLLDRVTVTSLTGYYNLHSHSLFNTSFAALSGPLLSVSNPRFRRRDFTEEVRVNSDFETPFNFTIGGFYQTGKVSDRITLFPNTFFIAAGASGIPLQDGVNRFTISSWSAFGQVRYRIVPDVELSGGLRVTNETRRQDPYLFNSLTLLGNIAAGLAPASAAGGYAPPTATPRIGSTRTSPELTITYKPTPDLNLFASYKIAYKSGSFSIATPPTLEGLNTYLDNSFGDEKVSGIEGGIKGRALDNQLNFSLGAFNYKYTGLQVGGIEPTVGSLPVIRTVNAGSGRSYGAEIEAHFSPRAIDGLTLNGAVNYTHARFKRLDNVPCYGGQTFEAGCNQQLASNGLYFAQDLSGAPFLRAPDWSGNAGFDYELPVGNTMNLVLSNNTYFTSKFLSGPGIREDFYQKGYVKFDAGITLKDKDDRWEVALIGKNLTREYTASNCSPSNFQNGLLGGEITGASASTPGGQVGPAGTDEMLCYMDPGRELWIRLTLRPFG
ncbi:TonB-dependent receptor [Novosphingobium album (ex Liu et al. 2023)]|uniref:TonB-dependent receptor n=1 Tax=Novosphingobium album (ex Liu et al. 2023) TaxID=3031130 RepID=A0ABT5WT09_9SPHN|nr:TonB-dependent receptor [Novosphingobium album (ex Liu et al. 2023)]MDE8653130.1 TonB-dependent receptor [Novosphingobium album (ex Liu et al. 2023)]